MTVALYEEVGYDDVEHTHERVGVYTDGEGWQEGGDRFSHVDDYPRDTSEAFLMEMYDDIRLYAAQFEEGAEPPATRGGSEEAATGSADSDPASDGGDGQ